MVAERLMASACRAGGKPTVVRIHPMGLLLKMHKNLAIAKSQGGKFDHFCA